MFCEICQEKVKDYYSISDSLFCYDCIQKYELVKCPTNDCDQIISLNNYNRSDEIDRNECSHCHIKVCDMCIVKYNNMYICKNCIYNE